VLAYSALFLAEDAGLLGIIAHKASRGVRVRIALGDPDCAAVAQRGRDEGIGDAMAAKVRNALTLYRPLMGIEHIGVRLHEAILYNSVYRADDQLFVNQHAYGVPAAGSPCSATASLGAATSPQRTLTVLKGFGCQPSRCSEIFSVIKHPRDPR
jgi:hypothetical protein